MSNRSNSPFVHSILSWALAVPILVSVIGLTIPVTAQAGDHSKFADIVDTDPNPLPHWPTPEDKEYIRQLDEQRASRAPEAVIMAAPPGDIWTPGEYEALQGVFVPWEPGSYLSLLTEFVVGVTTDSSGTIAYLIVQDASECPIARATIDGAGGNSARTECLEYNLDTVWIRHYGPGLQPLLGIQCPSV